MPGKIGFRKKIALELHRKYRHNAAILHQLKFILWEATLRCNLSCLHCGSDCKKDDVMPDMPVEAFLSAIDQIKPIVNPATTTVIFTGGEALLRKDLEQCGLELYKRGFPWGIVTNGFLLDKNRLQSLLNAGMCGITISLDGFINEHNWLRGNKLSFTKTTEAIDLLASTPELPFDVVTAVNQRNIGSLPEFKEFLISKGVKSWRIFTIFPIGRASENTELQLDNSQFKSLLDFIANIRKEKKIHLSYGCEGFLGNYEAEVRDKFFFCHSGIHTASILADGSITGCTNLRHNYIQGNVYKDNFADIWQHKFQIMRDKRWTKTGICAECESYRYCEGNGLHLRNPEDISPYFCHLERIGKEF
jgi:radical SAM enzyme (rSAM/lipoprotein system)